MFPAIILKRKDFPCQHSAVQCDLADGPVLAASEFYLDQIDRLPILVGDSERRPGWRHGRLER
jgi:hypothetical protein